MKLKILLMIKENYDVLILDEPTNHIDLHVREQLEEVLVNYNGTIILVTHDRYMLEKVCNKLLVFKDNKILRYEGGVSECLNKSNVRNTADDNKIIIENRISFLIGKLSELEHDSEEYIKYNDEYNNLIMKRKR